MAKDRSGYIFKDKTKGVWYARTTITDTTGKRRNIKRQAKDKREAKQILKTILRQLETGGCKAVDIARLTFNDLADFYGAHYCKPAEYSDGKKVAGLRDVARAQGFLVRFREHFGKCRLTDITYGDIHSYRAMRLKSETHYKRTPTIASMNRELGVLRRILNIGVREGWLPRNPLNAGEALISPSAERRRGSILTIDEERRLLVEAAKCDQPGLLPFLICLLDTGARRSEMLRLRSRSLCLVTRTIVIEAMTTKTLTTRKVSMTERMHRELSVLANREELDSPIFRETPRTMARAFARACKSAGIRYGSPNGITLHSLRHTAATRLVNGQMPLQMVGRILGHTHPQTTYRYLSADLDATVQAAAILESFQNVSTPHPSAEAQVELVN